MTETERREKNRQIALALGWTNLYATQWYDIDNEPQHVDALCGTTPDGKHDCVVPDFCGSLDAVAEVLSSHDAMLRLDFGPAYSARIIPEGRVNEPPMPEFYARSWEVWGETHEHPTIAELAGSALARYIAWRLSLGITP